MNRQESKGILNNRRTGNPEVLSSLRQEEKYRRIVRGGGFMGEIREEIFLGFCIACNRGQTVTCEFQERQGKWELEEIDCGYETCIHKGSCQIGAQVKEFSSRIVHK